MADDRRREIARKQFSGTPQDPTGVDRDSNDPRLQNDEHETHGDAGLEGGAAGKFTPPFRRDRKSSES